MIQMEPGGFAVVALLLGAQVGDEKLVRMALEYGADIEVAQGAPLLTAAAAGHIRTGQVLLKQRRRPVIAAEADSPSLNPAGSPRRWR